MNIQQLLRCKTILEEVEKGKNPSLNDINNAVNVMLERLSSLSGDKDRSVSERTIKRDINDIKNILGIYIEHSSALKGYHIDKEQFRGQKYEALLEAANLVHVLQNMENVQDYIAFEPRKSKRGIEHFFEIVEAIRKKRKIRFIYTHYEKKEETERIVSPLGLKEFKGFWYLVAQDKKGIKAFGLDRITCLSSTLEKSIYPKDFSLEKHYEHCYGIVRFDDEEPQEIKIKMLPIKAAYYKANPLHHSQKVIEETNEYAIISIYAYLPYDLQKELRSHGEHEVSVIQPKDGLVTKRYY